jgi:hypothetical protein
VLLSCVECVRPLGLAMARARRRLRGVSPGATKGARFEGEFPGDIASRVLYPFQAFTIYGLDSTTRLLASLGHFVVSNC